MKLDIKKQDIKSDIIGNLDIQSNDYQFRLNIENELVRSSILFSKFDEIKLDNSYDDVCQLTHHYFVFRGNDHLALYNKSFQFVKKITHFNGKKFIPLSITSDTWKDFIYIADGKLNRIIKVDKDLCITKTMGSTGSSENQFNVPKAICFSSWLLFICDEKNKRIQRYTDNLVFEKSFNFMHEPNSIKCSNNRACVLFMEPSQSSYINIYNLSNFNLLGSCKHGGKIIELNELFYKFCNSDSTSICCYDSNGLLIDKFVCNDLYHEKLKFNIKDIFLMKNQVYMLNNEKLLKFQYCNKEFNYF